MVLKQRYSSGIQNTFRKTGKPNISYGTWLYKYFLTPAQSFKCIDISIFVCNLKFNTGCMNFAVRGQDLSDLLNLLVCASIFSLLSNDHIDYEVDA